MALASPWIPALCNSLGQNQPTSPPVSPQITWLRFYPIIPTAFTFSSAATTSNSAQRLPTEVRTLYSAAGDAVLKGDNENNEDESLRDNAKYPRPQEVPWQKELVNKIYVTGVISQPVQFKQTQSGKAFAWTEIRVGTRQRERTMWFPLIFYDELAEIAAQHLKLKDKVCVSGRFTSWRADGEYDKPKVIANTLNFIQNTSLDFSEQVVVDNNTPSPALSRQAIIDGDTFQYQKFPVESSSSGKIAQEAGANIESLWKTFFANPFEWWDNRTKKRNPRAPDFKHKDSGEGLWIESRHSPSWLKSQLDVLDSRLGKWGESGSSTRSQGSLSSFQINDF